MTSKRRRLPGGRVPLALLSGAVLIACGDASRPTGTGRSAGLALSPRFAVSEVPFTAPPVDRIVLMALEAETSQLLGHSDVAVDPDASQWVLSLGVDLRGAKSAQTLVQLELYSGASVEWSGRSSPFEVLSGASPREAHSIDVYRGPLDNLDVISVDIPGAPSQMGVGTSLQLGADVMLIQGSDATPIVFWASSDPVVATVTPQGTTTTITALAPGTTRIIAGAGPAMDTVAVEVALYPTSVWVGGAVGGAFDWFNADNWNPVGVPDTLNDVLIDVATYEPVLTEDVVVHGLTVVGDLTIDLAGYTLTVEGDLDGDRLGSLTAVNGLVVATGSGRLVDGGFDRLRIDGDRSLADLTEVVGDLELNGAMLTVGAQQLTVGGGVDVRGASGRLVMQDPAGRVEVSGSATFNGASEEGFLTAGELGIGGDLLVGSASSAFVSSAGHATVLHGPGVQSVSFSASGPTGQRMNDVTIDTTAIVAMATNATITGDLTVSGEWVIPGGTAVSIGGTLTLQNGSTLDIDGSLTAGGGCTNLGATITGTGTHPCTNFDPGLGLLVAVAFDPVSRNLFVYDDFATTIHEYTQAGIEVLPSIPSPAPTSNDFDLDFMSVSGNVGGAALPANTLLVINGEVSPGVLFAIDKNDGTVLGSLPLPLGNPVGGTFDSARGTLFVVDWGSDTILEVELDTGATLATFPVAPAGSPAFDVYFGDVASDPRTGNLMVVSSIQNTVRVLTPTGAFVKDIDVSALGITTMSGIGWDAATQTAWITSTNGKVYRVGGLDLTAPTSRSTLNPLGETINWEARTSQTRTGSASIVMFDDFTFLGGSTLQRVAWQGIYCREVLDAPAPVPVATSFTVSFHADLAGVPDTTAALYSETLPVAQVAETLDLNGPASCGVTPSTTWGLYDYSATLSAPFGAAAGTRYWVSVVANLPTTDLYWGWRAGATDNAGSVQLFGGQFTTYGRDRAFFLGP